MTDAKTLVHGTAVAVTGADFPATAVLLRGFSGRGKSDLAFRLVDRGAVLIGDDQVTLQRRQDRIFAEAAENIRGLMEVRGLGLIKFPVAPATPLGLIVDLVPREDVTRLPDGETVEIMGLRVPLLKLHAFDISTPLKIIKAIEIVHKPDMLV